MWLFFEWFCAKIRHQIVSLMSCGRVIGYICVSLYYVSLQVNKIRSIFQICVGDECEIFGLVMWILMSSVERYFLILLKCWNAWFLLVKLCWSGCLVLSNLYWFFEDFDWVRLKPYFIRVERCFEGIFDDFWRCWNGEKHWFFKVLSNSVSNSKWGLRRENIRYAVPGNRTFVLKCKHSPSCVGYMRTDVLKYTIIV